MEIKTFLIKEAKNKGQNAIELAEKILYGTKYSKIHDGVIVSDSAISPSPKYYDKMGNLLWPHKSLQYIGNGILRTEGENGHCEYVSTCGASINSWRASDEDMKEFNNKSKLFFQYQLGKIELSAIPNEYFMDEDFVEAVKVELKSRVATSLKGKEKVTQEEKQEIREYIKSQLTFITQKQNEAVAKDTNAEIFKSRVFEVIDRPEILDAEIIL